MAGLGPPRAVDLMVLGDQDGPAVRREAALDPFVERFLNVLALSPPGQPNIADRRAALRSLARLAVVREIPLSVRPLTFALATGRCEARLYTPPDAPAVGPGIVFFHGGGLTTGDLDTHDSICRRLSASARCRVVAVAYGLAPEHAFPAALEDALAAVYAVFGDADDLGIEGTRLAVAGDSAGAGLAARVCQEMRGRGPNLAAQLLICPVLDLTCQTASHRAFASGYFLEARTIAQDIDACGVAESLENPRVSPLRASDLAGLPPAHIHTARFDIVRDDGAAYAERLRGAGVRVDHRCHDGMIHFFYGLGRLVPRSQVILDEIGAAFGAMLRGEPAARPADFAA